VIDEFDTMRSAQSVILAPVKCMIPILQMPKILLVEDDRELADTVARYLSIERNTVEVVHDGREGLERVLGCEYDVIILDIELPNVDGVEICRQFRARGGQTPMIMLTGRALIVEKELGLDAGADDYLTKPFSVRELSARLRALTRRPHVLKSNKIKVGKLTLDPAAHQISKDSKPLDLLPVDYALLEFLMRHPNQLFSADVLIEKVWHTDKMASSVAVRGAISRVRKAIDDEEEESMIETVSKVGYRLRS